jgi:hypothetical protein
MIYTVEYQKRGLPHAHIIIFLNSDHAFSESDQIDNIIRAELPNLQLDPDGSLTEIVKQIMVYGLYGPLKLNAVCMKKNHENGPFTCSKRFSKDFNEKTIISKDNYPEYRRRRMIDNTEMTWKEDGIYDNR